MRPRWSTACLLAALLQLAGTMVPASDLVICVAADGSTALELAVPGTARCGDSECEEVLAAADDHSCRDIPLLSAGDDLAAGPGASIQPAVLADVIVLPLPPPARALTHALPLGPLAAARQRRSVVLIV